MSGVLDRLETLATEAKDLPWAWETRDAAMSEKALALVAECSPATVAALVRELRGYHEIASAVLVGSLTDSEALDVLAAHFCAFAFRAETPA